MEKANSGVARRELLRATTGQKNSRIDTQKKKSNTTNVNEYNEPLIAKTTKGRKVKNTCPICLEAILDDTM